MSRWDKNKVKVLRMEEAWRRIELDAGLEKWEKVRRRFMSRLKGVIKKEERKLKL